MKLNKRDIREKEEGWIPFEKSLLVLNPHEIHLIAHLLSEELERKNKLKKISVGYINFVGGVKGHILNGGEKY